jgi:RNA polymerase sigma-70 factor (ECF subfamily)
MLHVAEHELLAFIDGELADDRRSQVDRHLEGCAGCTRDLEALRSASRNLSLALQQIDVVPDYDIGAVLARKRSRGRRHLTLRALAKAAVLVFAVGAAGAGAIPGSPVRAWIGEAWQEAKSMVGLAPEGSEPALDQPARSDVSRVAVAPADGNVRIDIRNASPEAMVRVVVVEGTDAAVTAEGARFRTGSGWIEVLNAAGEISIELPRGARSATVAIDGTEAVLKQGEGLRLVAPAADSSASELLFRVDR